MPHKPLTPCRYPGCPKLTRGRYCDEHQKLIDRQYNKYLRDPDTQNRYGYEWRLIRLRYLSTHPLCEVCRQQERLTPATEVHHIKPLARGGTHDESNLMSLCKSCHSEITAREGGRWGNNVIKWG